MKGNHMEYNPSLLVSADFLLTAAILRHFEKQRVSTANRLYALTEFPRHKDWGMHLPESFPDVIWFTQALDQISGREEEQVDTLTSMYNESPLAKVTAQYKGLGPGKLVARFLGETGDPYLQISGFTKDGEEITEPRPRTFSQLKSYCGMASSGGKLPVNTSGSQSSFSARARVRLWLISDQLVKQHDGTFHPVFLAGAEKYAGESYRGWKQVYEVAEGVTVKRERWSDAQFGVIGRKRARVLVGVGILRVLYEEARRLHDPEAHAAALADRERTAAEAAKIVLA